MWYLKPTYCTVHIKKTILENIAGFQYQWFLNLQYVRIVQNYFKNFLHLRWYYTGIAELDPEPSLNILIFDKIFRVYRLKIYSGHFLIEHWLFSHTVNEMVYFLPTFVNFEHCCYELTDKKHHLAEMMCVTED